MSSAARTTTTSARPGPAGTATPSPLLQRKCACGGAGSLGAECEDCRRGKLLGKPLQRKLAVGAAGDAAEREADRIGEAILQPRWAGAGGLAGALALPLAPPVIQRRAGPAAEGAAGEAPPIVHEVLASPGEPLDAASRSIFEPRLGRDLGAIRIHVGARAAESARSVDARAYTVGSHVVLGPGAPAAGTAAHRQLLGHELVHVVQQGAAGPQLQRAPAPAAGLVEDPVFLGAFDRFETDLERLWSQLEHGGAADVLLVQAVGRFRQHLVAMSYHGAMGATQFASLLEEAQEALVRMAPVAGQEPSAAAQLADLRVQLERLRADPRVRAAAADLEQTRRGRAAAGVEDEARDRAWRATLEGRIAGAVEFTRAFVEDPRNFRAGMPSSEAAVYGAMLGRHLLDEAGLTGPEIREALEQLGREHPELLDRALYQGALPMFLVERGVSGVQASSLAMPTGADFDAGLIVTWSDLVEVEPLASPRFPEPSLTSWQAWLSGVSAGVPRGAWAGVLSQWEGLRSLLSWESWKRLYGLVTRDLLDPAQRYQLGQAVARSAHAYARDVGDDDVGALGEKFGALLGRAAVEIAVAIATAGVKAVVEKLLASFRWGRSLIDLARRTAEALPGEVLGGRRADELAGGERLAVDAEAKLIAEGRPTPAPSSSLGPQGSQEMPLEPRPLGAQRAPGAELGGALEAGAAVRPAGPPPRRTAPPRKPPVPERGVLVAERSLVDELPRTQVRDRPDPSSWDPGPFEHLPPVVRPVTPAAAAGLTAPSLPVSMKDAAMIGTAWGSLRAVLAASDAETTATSVSESGSPVPSPQTQEEVAGQAPSETPSAEEDEKKEEGDPCAEPPAGTLADAVFYSLDVGEGAFTFAISGPPDAKRVVIRDAGVSGGRTSHSVETDPDYAFLANRALEFLRSRLAAAGVPRDREGGFVICEISISHLHGDHFNLLPQLLGPRGGVQVRKVVVNSWQWQRASGARRQFFAAAPLPPCGTGPAQEQPCVEVLAEAPLREETGASSGPARRGFMVRPGYVPPAGSVDAQSTVYVDEYRGFEVRSAFDPREQDVLNLPAAFHAEAGRPPPRVGVLLEGHHWMTGSAKLEPLARRADPEDVDMWLGYLRQLSGHTVGDREVIATTSVQHEDVAGPGGARRVGCGNLRKMYLLHLLGFDVQPMFEGSYLEVRTSAAGAEVSVRSLAPDDRSAPGAPPRAAAAPAGNAAPAGSSLVGGERAFRMPGPRGLLRRALGRIPEGDPRQALLVQYLQALVAVPTAVPLRLVDGRSSLREVQRAVLGSSDRACLDDSQRARFSEQAVGAIELLELALNALEETPP